MRKINKQQGKTKIILIISTLVIFSVIGFYFLKSSSKENLKVASNVITKDGKNKETFTDMQAKTDASMIGIKMNIKPVFHNGEAMGNIMLENTSNNDNSYVMSICINKNEEVYKSDLIEKGTRIDEIKLQKKLEKGKYSAVAYFTAYDKENNIKGKSGINMELNILN